MKNIAWTLVMVAWVLLTAALVVTSESCLEIIIGLVLFAAFVLTILMIWEVVPS